MNTKENIAMFFSSIIYFLVLIQVKAVHLLSYLNNDIETRLVL